ncbi:MAG: DnaJ domain-containing protein [Thermoanaerobaculia bacterium]
MSQDVDYYALLGVNREAGEKEIRERFRALAREAHPDRAPRELKAEAEAKFQDLTEAVNILTNPERRRGYDLVQTFKASGAAGDADSVTQNLMAHGMVAYRERQFSDAAGNFQLAVQRNPNDVRAQHYLGLAAARSGDMRTAVKALEIAISLEPHNAGLLKDAGTVFRQAGLLIKAEKAYQDSLRWDPSAAEVRRALEEVRAKRAVKS